MATKQKAKKVIYTFNHQKLAAALLKKRSEDILTQRDAAAAMGVSQPQFYKMELGFEAVSVNYFLQACTWLQLPPDFFINH